MFRMLKKAKNNEMITDQSRKEVLQQVLHLNNHYTTEIEKHYFQINKPKHKG